MMSEAGQKIVCLSEATRSFGTFCGKVESALASRFLNSLTGDGLVPLLALLAVSLCSCNTQWF